MADELGGKKQDFRLLIGTEPFDPSDLAGPSGRSGAGVESMIVQFTAPLTGPDVVRLQAEYGLELDRYIPNLAYLERLPAESVEQVRRDFLVRACVPLDPALKLAPSLTEQPVPGLPLELEATLFDDADPGAVESALAGAGARDAVIVDDPIGGRTHARFMVDEVGRLPQIAELDGLVWVEPVPDIVSTNADAAETIQSGAVGHGPIWDRGLHGEGQVIGVIDNGPIDIDHCFFADNPNAPGPGHRKVLAVFNDTGTSLGQAMPNEDEPAGHHATQVAGIAAGDRLGSPGTHPHRGGAWAAKLVVSNWRDRLRPASKGLLAILDRAKGAGAYIHTNSWNDLQAGMSSRYNKDARDVDEFSWKNEEHLVLASGSNTVVKDEHGQTVPGVNSPPGIAKNTLCVAAAKSFPNEMSRGSGVDGPTDGDKRRKPEIMAVGGELEVVAVGSGCETPVHRGYHTSFATPHAAAAAALVRQYFTEGWYPFGKRAGPPFRKDHFGFVPTGALIKAVLLNSTVDMTGHPGYPSDAEGWGLIRLNRTLYFEGGPRRLVASQFPSLVGLDARETRSHKLFVDSAEQLKITLVWMDPPPSEHAFKFPSINHLALKVTAPNDAEYVGNAFSSGVSTAEEGPSDFVNNVQMVIVDTPALGEWMIEISASDMRTPPADIVKPFQGYALVSSGGLDLARQFH